MNAKKRHKNYLNWIEKVITQTEQEQEHTETEQDRKKRIEEYSSNEGYNRFCQYYFPHYTGGTENAMYHAEFAKDLIDNKEIYEFLIIYRDGAKSVHANLFTPAYLMLIKSEIKCVAIVSATETLATMLLNDIKTELAHNKRIVRDFGKKIAKGSWEKTQFTTTCGVKFIARGINQPIVGLRNKNHRLDYCSIDDVEDNKKAKNTKITAEYVERVLTDILPAFQPQRGRLVIANNFRQDNGFIARLIEELANNEKTKIVWRSCIAEEPIKDSLLDKLVKANINITYKNEGARTGESAWKARFTNEYWQKKEKNTPTRTYNKEYKHNPITEGKIFKKISYKPITTDNKTYKKVVAYCDLSYKANSDFKAIAIVGFTHTGEYHIIDIFCKRTGLTEVIQWAYEAEELYSELAINWFSEASFAQDLFLEDFEEEGKKRGKPLPIKGDKRKKPDKFQRVEKISPLFDTNKTFFNQDKKYSEHFKEAERQLLLFEQNSGIEDDFPDALEGAIYLLKLKNKTGWLTTGFFKKKNSRRL